MDNKKIAFKYLKLIILVVLVYGAYLIFSNSQKDKLAPKNEVNFQQNQKGPTSAQADLQNTKGRLQVYADFFKTRARDIKLLESTASVNLNKELHLDKLYLKDLTTK